MKIEPWLAGAALSVAIACPACSSSDGNSGQVTVPASLAAAVPWANGAVPLLNPDGSLVAPSVPVFPTIGPGTPDPGSDPIDCSPLADIELSPFFTTTFEPDPTQGNLLGVGVAYSSYDDQTYGSFRVTGDASWYPGLATLHTNSTYWGLAADQITDGPSCDGQPNGWAMHFRGGRYNYYGAGVENPLAAIVPCPPGSDFCPQPAAQGATLDPVGLPLQNPDGQPFEQQAPHQYWDVSTYDGVVLWARCGPDSAADVLVTLQDKHTSDDLNRENQTFCQRIKTCSPTCLSGLPCTLEGPNTQDPSPRYRCFDPAVGMAQIDAPSEIEAVYPLCGPSACLSPYYDVDLDFDPTECKPYEFSGAQVGYYCYGGQPPPTEDERCGDAWVAPITLTTNWQIFVVPFTQFRQVGFGKPAPFMDLHSIAELAFEVPIGWADVYIDNVTFYRQR
jgi:hypothetical protein